MKRTSVAVMVAVLVVFSGALTGGTQSAAPCVDRSNDPAGCQPSTFDTPFAQMPSVRVNAEGKIDPFASEADARKGSRCSKRTSTCSATSNTCIGSSPYPRKDPATGAWRGGDLDGAGDGRGLGIAGNCLFVGHANGPGVRRAINIFRIQSDP